MRTTRDDVIGHARHLFAQGKRIDMQELAAELGIGRATLYRWVRDRDQLIAEAIWSIAGPFFDELIESTQHLRGRARILAMVHRMGHDLLSHDGYVEFLRREPAAALRILTTPETHVQQGMIDILAGIMREEAAHGALPLPPSVPIETLAFAVVRLAESFFYADIVARRTADVDDAVAVIELLLPAPPVQRPASPR